ncbi:hypothetical protein [Streptomyces shenzhenensis]|uniref:hypothetical protein n=1 Tax=Streptomyces shenzhenensis TaxID=943815 RepID=UPI0033F84F5D
MAHLTATTTQIAMARALEATGRPHPLLTAEAVAHPADGPNTEAAREHSDENATHLPALTRECEQRGLALQVTEGPSTDLPQIKVIGGRRTLVAHADELGIALDEVRHGLAKTGTCAEWPGLCTQTGEHDDHFNHDQDGETTGWPVGVGFVGLSDSEPLLYVDGGMAADFKPEDTPKVVAKLRAAAAALEALQAQVARIEAARA